VVKVTQKTSWFLNHRIREMLRDNAPKILSELLRLMELTLVGNIRINIRARTVAGKFESKSIVFGAVQREGKNN
jgi:hypothetical protein